MENTCHKTQRQRQKDRLSNIKIANLQTPTPRATKQTVGKSRGREKKSKTNKEEKKKNTAGRPTILQRDKQQKRWCSKQIYKTEVKAFACNCSKGGTMVSLANKKKREQNEGGSSTQAARVWGAWENLGKNT
jgi:hypothetical protein